MPLSLHNTDMQIRWLCSSGAERKSKQGRKNWGLELRGVVWNPEFGLRVIFLGMNIFDWRLAFKVVYTNLRRMGFTG
jgi:hypothetical protein